MKRKYKKNDRVDQAISVGKLAMFGGIAYAGYKIYKEYTKSKGPAIVKVKPEEERKITENTKKQHTSAGYISVADLEHIEQMLSNHDKGAYKLDATAYKNLKDVKDKVTSKEIKVIEQYDKLYPDPSKKITASDYPDATNKDSYTKAIIAEAIKTEKITRDDFKKLEALKNEAQPILKGYYEYKDKDAEIPLQFLPEKSPLSIKVLQMTQTFINETNKGSYMLDEAGNKKYIKIVEV